MDENNRYSLYVKSALDRADASALNFRKNNALSLYWYLDVNYCLVAHAVMGRKAPDSGAKHGADTSSRH